MVEKPHSGNLPLIGAHGPLCPNKYCIVIPNLIGNGQFNIAEQRAEQNPGRWPISRMSACIWTTSKRQEAIARKSRFFSRFAAPARSIGAGSMGGIAGTAMGLPVPDQG